MRIFGPLWARTNEGAPVMATAAPAAATPRIRRRLESMAGMRVSTADVERPLPTRTRVRSSRLFITISLIDGRLARALNLNPACRHHGGNLRLIKAVSTFVFAWSIRNSDANQTCVSNDVKSTD